MSSTTTSISVISNSQSPPALIFAAAYYASKNPLMQPLYNMRPGALQSPMLSQDAINSLINKCIAAGLLIDEQIDYWGWDPWTIMNDRLYQGILWVYAGLGNVSIPTVITPGEFSGPAPSGTIKSSITLSDYPAYVNPNAPVIVPVDPVGVLQVGPYYGVIGTNPPAMYTDSRGTFKLVNVPNSFLGMNVTSQYYQLT
jgi:hypothetical protein